MVEVGKKTLIVTGATGWLGRELLERLTSPVDQVSSDTTLISTRSKTLKLSSGREMLTQTYDEVTLPITVDGFVNLAFLTKEKVAKVGFDNFVLRNMELISRACRVIETSRPKWILSVSSGAVFRAGTTEFERDIRQNPYGFLKRVEELLLADAAQKVGSTLIIGRLWGSSGRYMPIHH
ncbi:MAG: NAD-dependent epimerase/dehydratase family protein, partial [Actinobacteria bacterium]|nr:NAD-dependent epimerase/dehydratase family protein [Actinomycetota bacterium]